MGDPRKKRKKREKREPTLKRLQYLLGPSFKDKTMHYLFARLCLVLYLCHLFQGALGADFNCYVDLQFKSISSAGDLTAGNAGCSVTLNYSVTACKAVECAGYAVACEGNVITLSPNTNSRGSCTVNWV